MLRKPNICTAARTHTHTRAWDCNKAGAGITAERELIWARRQQFRPIAADDNGRDEAPSGHRGAREPAGC